MNTLRRGRFDRDLQRELDFHIGERIDQLRADGMSLDQARVSAQKQFGSALRIREETHEVNNIGWIERLTNDLRVTFRMIRKSPGFAAAAILTLGLGIGSTTAVFSVVNAVLIRPLPYPEPDRLVGVWHSAQFQGVTSDDVRLSSTMYLTYREHAETFAEFGLWRSTRASVTGRGEPEQIPALVVTYGTLPAVGVPPMLGRWFTASDDSAGTPETVILSYGYWQRRFSGSASVIGTPVTIDSTPREVIGVMPQSFRFLNTEAAVFLPQRFQGADLLPNDVHAYVGIARLKPGVTLAQANADVGRMLPIWIRDRGTNANVLTAARFGAAVRPVKQDVVGDVGSVLWLLMGTIGLVLVIACANVANLLLVRAEGRRQEFTLRAALGAGWSHIARHLLVESLALALIGGALGVGLAVAGLQFLVSIGPATLPRLAEISIDPLVLGFALIVSLLSALLFGLLPVARHAGPRGAQALHGAARGNNRTLTQGRGQHRSRNTLVFVQVALAVVLLVAAGLMIRSFLALRSVEPGFTDPDGIQTLRLAIPEGRAAEPARVARVQQDIATEIAKISGVTSVSFTTALPMETDYENNTVVTAADKTYSEGIPQLRRSKSVSPGFFQTMGIPLLAGRDFTWTDIEGRRRVAIVSNNLAREWWGQPSAAIGRQIRIGRAGPLNEVIGVAGDIYDSGADQPPPTVVYWRAGAQDAFGPIPTFVPRDMAFAIRSDQAGTEDLIRQVGRAVWAVDASLPLARVQTLGETYAQSMSRTSFTLVMLAIAGIMALALGLVGIYGVISYAVTEQRRAIGIRLALGAARGSILGRFLAQALHVTAIACASGIVLSIAARGALSRLLFGVSPFDPLTLVSVAGVVLLVATLAALIPATRAALMQPMRTLREE